MKITLEVSTRNNEEIFLKEIESLWVPNIGHHVNTGDDNYRLVKGVYHSPGEIRVLAGLGKDETAAVLEEHGWHKARDTRDRIVEVPVSELFSKL